MTDGRGAGGGHIVASRKFEQRDLVAKLDGGDAVLHRHGGAHVSAGPCHQRAPIHPLAIAVVAPVEQGLLAAFVTGQHIIVLAGYEGGQQALLYRRSSSNGQWVYRRALVTWTGAVLRVAMKNGIAAVQFGDQISLFELSGGDYVPRTSAAPIRHHGGLAISGNSVLIGGNNCDYDAVVYQKNTAVAGPSPAASMTTRASASAHSRATRWNSTMTMRCCARRMHARRSAWRRNGSALDWVPAGVLALLPDEAATNDSFALQGATAVASNGVVWRRSGTSTWTRQGVTTSVDHDNSFGVIFDRCTAMACS